MDRLQDLERLLEEILDELPKWIRQAVEDNQEEIVRIQTEVQMNGGKRSDDTDISPFYALSTQKRKKVPAKPVTLFDTGKFYDSIKLEIKSTEFKITSPISYAVFLVNKYGAIFGLTPKNLEAFTKKYIVPYITEQINGKLTES